MAFNKIERLLKIGGIKMTIKNYKPVVIFLVLFLGVLLMSSCAEKSLVKIKSPKKAKIGEEFVVQKSSNRTPRWINEPEFQIVKIKGEKYIVVKVDVSAKDRRAAERLAEGELRKRVAEGIKTLVESQFSEAISGTQESYSESFQSYVATVARNIPVVGLIVTDTYWEKIERVKSKNEVEYYYRIVKRARMPYKNYVESRDKAMQDVIAAIQNEADRAALEKLIEKIQNGENE